MSKPGWFHFAFGQRAFSGLWGLGIRGQGLGTLGLRALSFGVYGCRGSVGLAEIQGPLIIRVCFGVYHVIYRATINEYCFPIFPTPYTGN